MHIRSTSNPPKPSTNENEIRFSAQPPKLSHETADSPRNPRFDCRLVNNKGYVTTRTDHCDLRQIPRARPRLVSRPVELVYFYFRDGDGEEISESADTRGRLYLNLIPSAV